MTTTLRTRFGMDSTPATLKDSTLILVDYQQTYTAGGPLELEGWEPALDAGADLLARAREAGTTVIHVINDSGPGSPYDTRGETGRIHPSVTPIEGENVVTKSVPNAFVGTDLAQLVKNAGSTDVIIVGFMTNMCVTFTSEGAFLNGFTPTVVADACATRPLSTAVADVPASDLHASALATIGDLYGVIVETADDLEGARYDPVDIDR